MKFIIPIIALIAVLASTSYSQVDTLGLTEIGAINLPDSITQLYTQDLNGDGQKEIILCTSRNIFIYRGDGWQLLWTSPTINHPHDLQFADCNGNMTVDIIFRDSVAITIYDWEDSFQILQINSVNGCCTIGDVNSDGNTDFVIANKQSHIDGTGSDTVWVESVFGPEFIIRDTVIIMMDNYYRYDPYFGVNSLWQFPDVVKIFPYGNINAPNPMIALYSKGTLYDNRRGSWWLVHQGDYWLINAETHQLLYQRNSGYYQSSGVIILNQNYIPYSLLSYNSQYTTSDDTIYTYSIYKRLHLHNPQGIVFSTDVWSYINTRADIIWDDWQGFTIADIDQDSLGSELVFATKDSIIEYSINSCHYNWKRPSPADSQEVKGTYHSIALYQSPQVVIKTLSPVQEYYFINGRDHSISAVMPYNNTEISLISDLNNDQNDEILSVSGNSLRVYSVLRVTSVEGEHALPWEFTLIGNYPNPFNTQSTIKYHLPRESDVKVEIYDIMGRLIEDIDGGLQPVGANQVIWDASGKPSGIYFYRLSAGDEIKTSRMILLK